MKLLKRVGSQLHTYVLWALLSFLIWGWVFNLISDTTTFKKVSVYIDSAICQDAALTEILEEDKPEKIEFVQVRPLSYVVFDEPTMFMGDILVLRESYLPNYVTALTPLTGVESRFEGYEILEYEGKPYGIKVYDAQTGESLLGDYVTYLKPWEENEDFYLFFMVNSRHIAPLHKGADDIAFRMAEKLLTLGE